MADNRLYSVTGSLAIITLSSSSGMNTLDRRTKDELRDAVERAAADRAVRAVLLTGSGRSFCVGQDLKEHVRALAEEGEERGSALRTVEEHYSPIARTLATMPKPVVAGVNGVAAGAGFGFALAADYRVVAASATFNTAFAAIGLTADSGLSWTLPRVVGPGRAADLLLFPRSLDAAEAERLGIAQRVVPDEDLPRVAEETALRLAAGPTAAYAAIKEALAFGAAHSLAETLVLEGELQVRAGATADHRAAVDAFVAKRQPEFSGE